MVKGYPDWTKPVGVELQAVTLDANVVSGLINVARGIIFNKPSAPLGWLPVKYYCAKLTNRVLIPESVTPQETEDRYEDLTTAPQHDTWVTYSGRPYYTRAISSTQIGGIFQLRLKYHVEIPSYGTNDYIAWKWRIAVVKTVDSESTELAYFETLEHSVSFSSGGTNYTASFDEGYDYEISVADVEESAKIELLFKPIIYMNDDAANVHGTKINMVLEIDPRNPDTYVLLPLAFKNIEA